MQVDDKPLLPVLLLNAEDPIENLAALVVPKDLGILDHRHHPELDTSASQLSPFRVVRVHECAQARAGARAPTWAAALTKNERLRVLLVWGAGEVQPRRKELKSKHLARWLDLEQVQVDGGVGRQSWSFDPVLELRALDAAASKPGGAVLSVAGTLTPALLEDSLPRDAPAI